MYIIYFLLIGFGILYLRINDFQYAFHKTTLEIIYKDIYKYQSNSGYIVIGKYVCLFDDQYKIIDEVWEYLQSRLHSKKQAFNSVVSKGRDLKIYYDFLNQYKLEFSKVKYKHINDFIAWLMLPEENSKLMHLNITSKRTAKSVNRTVSTVKDFYKYIELTNDIKNPFEYANETIKRPTRQHKTFYTHTQNGLVQKSTFKIKEFDNGIRVLTQEQLNAILDNCSMQRDKLLFELLMLTGIRIGEALSLDIHAIGVAGTNNSIEELKMLPNINDFSKGNRERQQKSGPRDIFIPSSLMEKLNDYYENTWLKIYEDKQMDHNYFFISETQNMGDPLSYQTVWNRCNTISKKIGFKFSPHDFRHTFATYLARNKVGIHKLRKLLGHTHIASTDIYIQIASKEEIINELIPFYEAFRILDE